MKKIKIRIISMFLVLALSITSLPSSKIISLANDDSVKDDGWKISGDTLSISKFVFDRSGRLINDNWKSDENAGKVKKLVINHPQMIIPDDLKEGARIDIGGGSIGTGYNLGGIFKKLDLESVEISGWDLSRVDGLKGLFANQENLKTASVDWKLPDNAVLNEIFQKCTKLEKVKLAKWDVSKAKSMKGMFYQCKSLYSLDIGNWDVSNVESFNYMFFECFSMTNFNLNTWKVSKSADVTNMFYRTVNISDGLFTEYWDLDGAALCKAFGNYENSIYEVESRTGLGVNFATLTWHKAMPNRYMGYIRTVKLKLYGFHADGSSDYSPKECSDHKDVFRHKEFGPPVDLGIYDEGDRKEENYEGQGIQVYQNSQKENDIDDKTAASGAVLKNGDKEAQCDKSGEGYVLMKEDTVEVSKEGYVTRKFTKQQLAVNSSVRLQKKSDSYPVISGVWIKSENFDVMNNEYAFEELSKVLTLEAEIDWGTSAYGEVILEKPSSIERFKGNLITTTISDTSDAIKITAKDKAGHTNTQELHFTNNFKFEFDSGKNFSIRIPKADIIPKFLQGTELSVSIDDETPVHYAISNGVVSAIIGQELYSASGTLEPEGTKEVENKVNQIKDDLANLQGKEKGLKNVLKGKKLKGDLGLEADFNIEGYVEFVFDDGGLKPKDFGMGLTVSAEVSKDYNTVIAIGPVPLPVYVEGRFLAEAKAKIEQQLFRDYAYTKKTTLRLEGELSTKLQGGLEMGVGNKKVAYFGGGGEVTFTPSWKMGTDEFKIGFNCDVYLAAGILWYEKRKEWPVKEIDDITKINNKKGLKKERNALANQNFELMDVSNSKKKSKFLANNTKNQTSTENTIDTVIQSNNYNYATPKIVSLNDNKKIAVWENMERKIVKENDTQFINDIQLYYSFYDGSKWTAPEKVLDDGTADLNPSLTVIDNNAYLTWENANKKITPKREMDVSEKSIKFTDLFETKDADLDIAVGVFDEKQGKFMTCTYQKENIDNMPCITGKNAKNTYVVWTTNDKNEYWGDGKNNAIYSSKININTKKGTISFEEPKQEYKNLRTIGDLAADLQTTGKTNEINIAYTIDQDTDMLSTNDFCLYENGKKVSEQEGYQTAPKYVSHKLYWYDGKSITNASGKINGGIIAPSNYDLIETGKGILAVFTESKGKANHIKCAYLDEETNEWSKPFDLDDTAQDTYTHGLSVCANENGDIFVLANTYSASENFNEVNTNKKADSVHLISTNKKAASLHLISTKYNKDIEVNNLSYNKSAFCKDKGMYINFTVTNKGTEPINSCIAELKDNTGKTIANGMVYKTIYPGNTVDASIYYIHRSNESEKNVTLEVKPEQGVDQNLSDNKKECLLKFEDLELHHIYNAKTAKNQNAISAEIVNWGYQARKKIKVSLVKGDTVVQGGYPEVNETNRIATKTVESLDSLEGTMVSFTTTVKENERYYIVIEDENDETITNNYDSVFSYVGKTTKATQVKKPSKISGVKIKSNKNKKAVVTWKKQNKVAGYQLQYSKDSKFKSKLKAKTAKNNKMTLKSLTNNNIYYIRVRAYRTDGKKKVYGKWSKVVKVKVK